MRFRSLLLAGTLALAAGLSLASATARAGAATDPAAGLKLESTSQYSDSFGVTHLLGYVVDTGDTVEQPEVILDLLDSTGTQTVNEVGQFFPLGWLENGEKSPFDYVLPAGMAFSGKWKVDHFEGQVSQVVPSHKFTVSNVTGPTSSSDTDVLHGDARNDNGYPVQLIKVEVTFFNASGGVSFVEPTDVNSNDTLIQPGAEYPFALPRITDAPIPDVMNRALIVEANEAGTPNPAPSTGLADPSIGSSAFPSVPTYRAGVNEHAPVTNGNLDGVPDPSSSDLAGLAHPGRVVRQHDTKPVNHGSDAAEALVNQSHVKPAPRTTAAYAPILLIALLGGYGLLAAFGSLRSGIAGFREKRALRRETLASLAPGAAGGYGAMPGSSR